MRKVALFILLTLLNTITCSNMFEDLDLYSGLGFNTYIFVAGLTSGRFYILDASGNILYYRDNTSGPPPYLERWDVNKYNERIFVENNGDMPAVLIKRPSEELRIVGTGFDSVDAIAAAQNGDFYFVVNQSAVRYLFVLPYGSNEMQLRTNLMGLGSVNRIWPLKFSGREILYVHSNYDLYASTDGGRNFQIAFDGDNFSIKSMIVYRDKIFVLIEDSGGTVYTSTDGYNFVHDSNASFNQFIEFAVDKNKKLYAISSSQVFFTFDGINWQQAYPGTSGFMDIATDHTGRVYILHSTNGLYVSNDGGFNINLLSNAVTNGEEIKIVEWK